MKTFKMVMGILLFWGIVLIGGGFIALAIGFVYAMTPAYGGKLDGLVTQLIPNLLAAVLACTVLEKLTDNNEKAIKINCLLAFMVTAVLTVMLLFGEWTWIRLISFILVVIFFGVKCGNMMLKKEEAPGVSAPRAKEKEEGE